MDIDTRFFAGNTANAVRYMRAGIHVNEAKRLGHQLGIGALAAGAGAVNGDYDGSFRFQVLSFKWPYRGPKISIRFLIILPMNLLISFPQPFPFSEWPDTQTVPARAPATNAEIVSPSPPQHFVGERAGVRWLVLIPVRILLSILPMNLLIPFSQVQGNNARKKFVEF